MDEADRYAGAGATMSAILAGEPSFDDAARAVIRTVCTELGWDVGLVWRFDAAASVLRFVGSWRDSPGGPTALERLSEGSSFPPGVGMPGRVLASREPAWIPDVWVDHSFPRRPAAEEDGLHAGFGIPLLHGRGFLGVIEFFCHEVRRRDDALLRMMAPVGEALGRLLASAP